ncbi:hypothetical protein GF318_02930 [Candidatus Micrarchaeota archaeon]|nr:hypothetical protein [Candidatus Micrarchaeota archaeon]
MEFDELLITTGVDALVRLVKERERVEIEDAAAILNIPVNTLEDWSRVLEEEGILRIEYRLTHIYLVWIKPSAVEVKEETESFYEEKKDIQKEVREIKEKVQKETEGLHELHESFTGFYDKAYSRIEELEKTVAPIPAAKTLSEGMYSDYQKDLEKMSGELAATKKGITKIRSQIDELGIERETSPSQEIIERMEKMKSEMQEMQQEIQRLEKTAKGKYPKDVKLPSTSEIKKKFESVKKNFQQLRSRNAKLREGMLSLQESSEILHDVAESIMGQEEKIENLNNEVRELAGETDKLFKKMKETDEKAKRNVEIVERLGDSVDVAKNILKKFPSQKKVVQELDQLKAQEQEVMAQTKSLEKILEAAGGKRISAKKFEELSKKMDTKSKKMSQDLEALESALRHEKSTYLTFQRIKEKIVPSIESYQKKLSEMESKITTIRQEASSERKNLEKDAKELQQKLKGGQMQGIMKVAEEIREKKKMLEEIRSSLNSLVSASENLHKRVTLLSREARLLQIRAGEKTAPPIAPEKEEEIRHQLELSKEEEEEFRRKREELKKLIKRLWETQ